MKRKSKEFTEEEMQRIKDYYVDLGLKTNPVKSFENYLSNQRRKDIPKEMMPKLLGNWNRIRNRQNDILSGVYEDKRVKSIINDFKHTVLNRFYVIGNEDVNVEWLDKKMKNSMSYNEESYYKLKASGFVQNLMSKINLIPKEDLYNLILTDSRISFKSLAPYTISPFVGDVYDSKGNKITQELQEDIRASYGIEEYNSNVRYGDDTLSYLESIVDNYLDKNKDFLNLNKTSERDVDGTVTNYYHRKRNK